VTIQASPGNIGDVLLGVMLFSLSLVVAFIAIHGGAGPTVAAGTIPTGVPVIHGEGVPRHADAGPVASIMAL
jgi:hypothetical protein